MVVLWIIIWATLLVAVATGFIYTAFLALCTYKLIEESGVEIPLGIKRTAQVWYALGLPADVIYNLTVGRWRFGEFSGVTYSEHIQNRVDRGLWDHDTSMWALFLNAGRKGHIKRMPEAQA